MNKTFRWLGVLALAAAIEGGADGLAWAQAATGAEPTPNASGPAQGYAVGPAANAAGDQTNTTQVTPATELPVLYITGLEVLHTQTQPPLDIVRVTGLTGSQGWSAPQLVPTFVGKPLDGILDLQFIATMPEQTQPATGFVPIGAVFTLEGGHQFKGVRVRASENAIEVDQIPGASQANIQLDDCKDCVGKKFAEKGQAQPGAPGIVRQEDLPKVLRWIIPSRGIRGITHNPNRLNLILSSDNTIVAAYWE
ncbi:MAG TPA: hypothetical protein VFQ82_03570 [Stellaceae bacterium]|nr:hypothetical protein [Stellaceae bacterium]